MCDFISFKKIFEMATIGRQTSFIALAYISKKWRQKILPPSPHDGVSNLPPPCFFGAARVKVFAHGHGPWFCDGGVWLSGFPPKSKYSVWPFFKKSILKRFCTCILQQKWPPSSFLLISRKPLVAESWGLSHSIPNSILHLFRSF